VTALHVGLNLIFLQERSGGTGRYARELAGALLAAEPDLRLTLFVSGDAPSWVRRAPWAGDVRLVRFPVRPSAPHPAAMVASLATQWGALPAAAARRRVDVVHGLANVVPPWIPRTATVVTLHDLIWTRHAGTMNLRGTLGMRVAAPVSGRTADRVITGSVAARDDLVAMLGVPRDRIDVVPHGVSVDPDAPATPAAELRARLGLGEDPVLLCIAQLRSHKNLDGLIRAHALMRTPGTRLVLVGPDGGEADALRGLAAREGTAERVHFTGWVSDAGIEGLYRLAAAFVLPSFDEGFGLPVLEAMARDVPVACSGASSLPEVAGDAALLFDPRDHGAIAAALDRLLGDAALAQDLRARGRRRAAGFTWEASARATLASYRRALAERSRNTAR